MPYPGCLKCQSRIRYLRTKTRFSRSLASHCPAGENESHSLEALHVSPVTPREGWAGGVTVVSRWTARLRRDAFGKSGL